MKNTLDRKSFQPFDFLYMFVMVIYMGQATPETSRMVVNLSGNPIPFLIPIVLTMILWNRNKVSIRNKNLGIIMVIYCVWAMMSLIKNRNFSSGELSYHFFMIYAIVVAYLMDKAYGYKLLTLYEKVCVCICKISLALWFVSHIIPPIGSLFSKFPIGTMANNILYVYQWHESWRNFGCAWEPGRFSIMIVLAIYCNLCRNDIKFKDNKDIWWLLLSLASTMSTTGYCSAIIVYILFYIKRLNLKKAVGLVCIILPLVFALFQLDFMQGKISKRIDESQHLDKRMAQIEWHNEETTRGENKGSLDRFEAMVFEWKNFTEDPLLGYGRNFKNSFFYKHISTNFRLTHGFMKVFSMYGIFLGLIFYYILYKSSRKISDESRFRQPICLFVLFLMMSMSYSLLSVPIFTSFWFYGIFSSEYPKPSKLTMKNEM